MSSMRVPKTVVPMASGPHWICWTLVWQGKDGNVMGQVVWKDSLLMRVGKGAMLLWQNDQMPFPLQNQGASFENEGQIDHLEP